MANKTFDEKGFTQYALKRGWSQDQIDQAVNDYKAKNDLFTGLVQKYGDAIPAVMGVAGAVGGAILTAPAFGVGSLPGGAIGYGSGVATEDTLKKLVGLKSKESVGGTVAGSLGFGAGASLVGSGVEMAAQAGSNPAMRTKVINSLPEEQQYITKDEATAAIDKFTKSPVHVDDPNIKAMDTSFKESLFGKEGTETQTDKIHLNDFYDRMKELEQKHKAYSESGRPINTGAPGVANNISGELRSLANEKGGEFLKLINQLMSGKLGAQGASTLMSKIKGLAFGGARYLLFREMFQALRSSQTAKKTW